MSSSFSLQWFKIHASVPLWNNLPSEAVSSTDLRAFKLASVPGLPRFYGVYHLPRKSKRARNGEGLGPRLLLSIMYHLSSCLHNNY